MRGSGDGMRRRWLRGGGERGGRAVVGGWRVRGLRLGNDVDVDG